MICTFFGHGDCYDVDVQKLQCAIEDLILNGVDTFYVGNQGYFDRIVFECLLQLKEIYHVLRISVVLAYLPTTKSEYDPYLEYSIYPEGMEAGPPRFAIERRNRWMIDQSNCCLCYINHAWGGAYKFARQAKRKGVSIINLGSEEI
jgi:uncharacterized phage-like protein YoqJ